MLMMLKRNPQVNRLSRELTVLRQQTASAASTTSSTSTTFNDPVDTLHSSPYLGGYTPARHRSSSSLSSAYVPAVQESRAGNVSRDPGLPFPRPVRSRQQSVNSVHHSEMASPSLSSSLQQGDHFPPRSSHSHSQPATSALSRLEEVAQHRGELESIKHENEALCRRVRDLEQALRKSQGDESTFTDKSALTSELKKTSIADAE